MPIRARTLNSLPPVRALQMSLNITAKFWLRTLDAVHNGGNALHAHFKACGITSNTTLLSHQPSFRGQWINEEEIASLHADLLAKNQANGGVQWPSDHEKGHKYIRSILVRANAIYQAEEDAAARDLTDTLGERKKSRDFDTDSSKTKTESELEAFGARLFRDAKTVFPELDYSCDQQVKHSTVAKIHQGFQTGKPYAIALNEFALELRVSREARSETYSFMGKEYVAQDGDDKVCKIDDIDSLIRQMKRRFQAKAVAGAFCTSKAAKERGEAEPLDEMRLKSSATRYIGSDDAIKSIQAYATPKGLMIEIDAMLAFRTRNPHISIAKIVKFIDAPIQRHLANLQMNGMTADCATHQICKKSPELYAPSLCEGSDTTEPKTTETKKEGGKRVRTEDETAAAMKNRAEQLAREVANLKAGKGRANNKPVVQFQQGNQFQQGGFQHDGKGKGKGKPAGPVCPQDYCKKFNFTQDGCSGVGCRFKHKCAECHSDQHPYRGNH